MDEGKTILLNQCFVNRNEEDEKYPLTVKEIVEAQKADSTLKQYFKCNAVLDNGLELLLIENESCICHKEGWQPLQVTQLCGITTIFKTLGIPASQRDDGICDILERNGRDHPIQNKVMQDLPSE